MIKTKRLLLALGLLPVLTARPTLAQTANVPEPEVVYPANAGVLNVRDFGAKGDGATDDTGAIQKALSQGLYSHHIVYLPNGVYLVSDTLKWNNGQANNASGWGGFLQVQGQSRAHTIIRLRDNAPGFGDENAPKAVLATGSGAGDGNKHYFVGEGNEAFENHLRDFTVETGKGNPGAIGIEFQASNCGALRHVTIRGDGYCGLSLMRRDNGPGLVKDVTIDGFAYGVRAQQELCHFTFENIQLTRQRVAGMWLRDAIFAIRKLSSQNTVPALQISGIALVNIFDSILQGTGAANHEAALDCSGSAPRVFARGLTTTGYAGSIKSRDELITNTSVDEWSSDDALGPLGPHAKSLGLPVRETPTWFDPNPQNWADAGAPSGGDDTPALQAALNSDKATVYCRYGTYHIKAPLLVPSNVKLIMGVGTSLDLPDKLPDNGAVFRFAGGGINDLTIVDRFTVGCKGSTLVEHDDARTVVLRDITPFDTPIYRNVPHSGPLFIEDVSSAGYRFAPGAQVWARQWNIEGMGSPKVFNDGGTVWALGWKTEGGDTIAENRNGGRIELWGGLPYTFGVSKRSTARAFEVEQRGDPTLVPEHVVAKEIAVNEPAGQIRRAGRGGDEKRVAQGAGARGGVRVDGQRNARATCF